MAANAYIALHTEGVSVVLDITDGRLPAIVHWGAELGELTSADVAALRLGNVAPRANNTIDEPIRLAVLPEHWTGWIGRPGISGSRSGRDWSPKFTATAVRVDGRELPSPDGEAEVVNAGPATVEVRAVDEVAELGSADRVGADGRRPAPRPGRAHQHRRRGVRAGRPACWPYPVPDHRPRDPRLRRPLGQGADPAAPAARTSAPTCARDARAGPVPTRRPCCTSARPASASPTARSGRCTRAGAATTRTTPSGSRPASR